jgi:hypothetical protein
MALTIAQLLGEPLTTADPYGQDLCGPDLYAGYIPGRGVEYIPQVTMGDGLAGPLNIQQLQIQRDDRPIAVDELGRQGPFQLAQGMIARIRAGHEFPLNYEYGPAALDNGMVERVPEQDAQTFAPYGPDQSAAWGYDGTYPPEVLPSARTVFYTASPNVGWDGY